jgi:hypothetical protein
MHRGSLGFVALNTVISRPQDEQVSSHTFGPLAASALRVSGVRRPPSCAMSDLLSRQNILTAQNLGGKPNLQARR